MAKPADFYVGVIDLFSVLLPGACVAFVTLNLDMPWLSGITSRPGLKGNAGYAAFFVVAYVLGHLMEMVGVFLNEVLHKATTKRLNKLDQAYKLSLDPLEEEAKRLAAPAMVAGDSVYQWSKVWVCLKCPAAFSEIERMQANSRFCYGLVGVFLITGILLMFTKPQHGRVIAVELVCFVLALFAFVRSSNLAGQALKQTYRYFIATQRDTTGPVPASRGEIAGQSIQHQQDEG